MFQAVSNDTKDLYVTGMFLKPKVKDGSDGKNVQLFIEEYSRSKNFAKLVARFQFSVIKNNIQ